MEGERRKTNAEVGVVGAKEIGMAALASRSRGSALRAVVVAEHTHLVQELAVVTKLDLQSKSLQPTDAGFLAGAMAENM